jgi:hypothetical protein
MRRTAILVAGLALLATACIPDPPPPPENGRLPDSMLTTVTPTCRVVSDISFALSVLIWDANAQGVGLRPETTDYLPPGVSAPRIESCYRSFEIQQWWRDWYCWIGNCGLAAVPGTSVHGWGRAVDFEDQFGELTFNAPGYQWLVANAWKYGFVHPAWAEPGSPSAEAWHWEHP